MKASIGASLGPNRGATASTVSSWSEEESSALLVCGVVAVLGSHTCLLLGSPGLRGGLDWHPFIVPLCEERFGRMVNIMCWLVVKRRDVTARRSQSQTSPCGGHLGMSGVSVLTGW